MPHCDEDDLAVIALGEPAGPEDEAHLRECVRCQSRLDQLAAVVTAAREITDDDRPAEPPASVWAAIEVQVRSGGDEGDGRGAHGSGAVLSLADARDRRRPRAWWVISAAAAAGLVIGGVATSALVSRPTGEVVATADLSPVEGSSAMGPALSGTAAVVQTDSGPALRVTVADLPPVADGYYEVWMATPDTATMVAIGTLNPGSEASFTLPQGMAVDAFPVVDVSVEHFDGDAGHSATSVVRGELRG